jgi:hypothetical protein
MKLKCIRNLFKSTYKGMAFDKDQLYTVLSEEDGMIYIEDNLGNEFNFVKSHTDIYYQLSDYFEV